MIIIRYSFLKILIEYMNLFLFVEYVVFVVYLYDLRYVIVCVCMFEYYLYKSYGFFFFVLFESLFGYKI